MVSVVSFVVVVGEVSIVGLVAVIMLILSLQFLCLPCCVWVILAIRTYLHIDISARRRALWAKLAIRLAIRKERITFRGMNTL